MAPATNIVIFGETGAGKSSVINMLSSNERAADISSGAKGCTFESKAYPVSIQGTNMLLWDTSGLNEGDKGSVAKTDAIVQLYRLVRRLSEGVNLLVFVMRAPRIKEAAPKNWKLFDQIICQKKVPSVIVITGLEAEDDMDQWWIDNKGVFQAYDIHPSGFACITATRGKESRKHPGSYAYDDEYEESREKVIRLFRSSCLSSPWRVPAAEWFKTIVVTTYETQFFGLCPPKEITEHKIQFTESHKQLTDCGLPEKDVKELMDKLNG